MKFISIILVLSTFLFSADSVLINSSRARSHSHKCERFDIKRLSDGAVAKGASATPKGRELSSRPRAHFLARITVYSPSDDGWTRRLQSATGVTLRNGMCAVDPRRISYGSRIRVKGWGVFTAVDTGSAVQSRKASHGRLPVIDIFCPSKRAAKEAEEEKPQVCNVEIL